MAQIRQADMPADLSIVRALLCEYARGLEVDLAFQGFEQELATLPGSYRPPGGALLLACRGGAAVGCVALRPLHGRTCELKRLFIRPEARGGQLGRRLVSEVMALARAAGHERIVLDTLPTMASAQRLYRSLGFEPTAPYTHNPVPGALFMAKALNRPAGA